MNRILALFALTLLVACANTEQQENIVRQNNAVEDYIASAELTEIDAIKARGQISHKEITEKHVILQDSRNVYLATFHRRCRELRPENLQPDYRQDANTIRARFDTYRGCRIERLFKLSEGQETELIQLGKTSQQ